MAQINYERSINEIQALKKQLNIEKLSHESTLTQLESSHRMNTQLQQIIKSQTDSINQLKKQLSEKTIKLQNYAISYEEQLIDMKNLIESKDEELKKMRKNLSVTDYDMIRLRILNQVEIGHHEELQSLKHQLTKAESIANAYKIEATVNKEKWQIIHSEVDEKQLAHQVQLQERERMYNKQLNKMFNQIQAEQSAKRQLQRGLEALTKKYQNLHEKYEKQMNKLSFKQSIEPQQIKSKPNHTQSFQKQLRGTQQELKIRQNQLSNLRKKYNQQSQQLKNKTNQLERLLKNKEFEVEQLQLKLKEKNQEISQLQRSQQRAIKQLKEDFQDEQRRWQRQKNTSIQNENKENSRIHVNRNQLEIRELQEKNYELTSEIQHLKRQLKKAKQQRSKNPPTEKQTNYKEKLAQANKVIVTLLKQKALMKELGGKQLN